MLLDGGVSWSEIDITKYVFYGGAFTVAVDAVIYPMELLKTKLQVDSTASPTLFRATFSALRSTVAAEGVRGLYKGFFLYTLGGLPSQGAYFLGYNYAKETLVKSGTRADGVQVIPDAAVYLGAGFFADVVAAPLWTPVDVVMQRLQIQGPGVVKYNGVWHAFSSIFKSEGIRGIFRGLGASIITFGPASALWWALYEGTAAQLLQLRAKYLDAATGPDAGNVPWVHGVAGFIAGAVSSMLTNPLDIAKTRLQTQHSMIREYESELHAALRDARERDVAASKARKHHFFRSLHDLRERQRDAARGGKHHRGSSPSEGGRSRPAGAATPAAANTTTGVKQSHVVVMRATAAAATAVGAVRTAADTLRSSTGPAPGAPASATTAATSNVVEPAAAPGGARRHAEHAPTIRAVPYQSTVSRTPAVIEAAASTAKAAILDAEHERVGRKRRAPNAAALVAAANEKRPGGHFYPSIAPKLKTNIASILVHIVQTEGAAALLRGMFPRMMLHGPASAATFVCYEQVLRLSRRTPAGTASGGDATSDPLR